MGGSIRFSGLGDGSMSGNLGRVFWRNLGRLWLDRSYWNGLVYNFFQVRYAFFDIFSSRIEVSQRINENVQFYPGHDKHIFPQRIIRSLFRRYRNRKQF
jgi:hypothetical protein